LKTLVEILVFFQCSQEFDDPRDADDAVYELNGKEMLGERFEFKPIFSS